jgi:hypothetical protein
MWQPFAIFHCHWKSMDSWVGTINTQHYGTTAKTGWLGIRIMCPIGETCLPSDCCFNGIIQ